MSKRNKKNVPEIIPTTEILPTTNPTFPTFIVTLSLLQMFLHYYNQDGADTEMILALIYDPKTNLLLEPWRLVTVALTHADSIHLWGNIVTQYFVGAPIERTFGWVTTASIYLWGTLGGTVGNPGDAATGGSGGTFALMTALILDIILQRYSKHVQRRHSNWRGYLILINMLVESVAWVYLSDIKSFFEKEFVNNPALTEIFDILNNPSHCSHIGGALMGAVLASYLFTRHGTTSTLISLICKLTKVIIWLTMISLCYLVFTKRNYIPQVTPTDNRQFLAFYNEYIELSHKLKRL